MWRLTRGKLGASVGTVGNDISLTWMVAVISILIRPLAASDTP
jgi:hypothetical protein